jgi:uracil-DNA glycosylase family 4
MLVGEGPGYNEIIQKAPFVGRSGQLLSALLKAAGIDRDDCYVANATACLPPKEDTTGAEAGSLMESFAGSVQRCLPRLEFEIAQVRPRVIVGLGNAALTALAGEEKSATKRVKRECGTCGTAYMKKCPECDGKKTVVVEEVVLSTPHTISWVAGMVIAPPADGWLASYGVRYVVPTYHPAYLLRKAETNAQRAVGGQFAAPAVVAHLAKAHRLLRSEARWKMSHTVTRDPAVVDAYVADPKYPFAIDIETDSEEWSSVTQIVCIGLGRVDREEVLVVDTENASPALLDALRRFLTSRTHHKILQNRSYDEACIQKVWGCITRGTTGDTLLQHHALWSDELHDLHRIGARYTDVPPWKPAKKSRGREVFGSKEEFWLYNARDVRVTAVASVAMDAEIVEERVGAVYAMDMKMSDIAIDMQLAGVAFDASELKKLAVEKGKAADAALGEIRAAATIPEALWVKDKKRADRHLFNPHSVPQVRWLLYGADGPCKLHAPKKTKTGESTDKEALRWLVHPLVDRLKEHRGAQKVVSTIENYLDYLKPDGRLYPSWRPFGARSGRWSSSPNLQNVDPIIRSAIVAPLGYKLVGADESQLELRILAALTADPKLIDLCANADESRKLDPENDPHSYVAARAFGRTFLDADPKGRKLLRDIAKRVVYALNYGAGAAKIADNIMSDEDYTGPPVRVDMIQRLIHAYFESFPGVPTWRDGQIRTAARTRETRSAVLGRRRCFPLGDADSTIVYNHPIQATAADLVDEMMLSIYAKLEDVAPGAAVVMQVHDAIYIECLDKHVGAVKQLMESSMNFTRRLTPDGPEMPFAAKAKAAQSWAELG